MSNVLAATLTNYTVQMVMSGEAEIRVFRSIEPNGGTNYLFDTTTASNQVALTTWNYVGQLGVGHPIVLKGANVPFWLTNPTNLEHLIFCGAKRGSGFVELQVLDANQNLVARTGAHIQLKDIKEMYERWTVGEAPSVAPMPIYMNASEDLPKDVPPFHYSHNRGSDTNQPYILFVHGSNMETWEKDRFAEAAYKRLYWQGYQGRFGSFRWPTMGGFDLFALQNPVTAPNFFDKTEFNAWRSGEGLRRLLVSLNGKYPGRVRMFSHSMGNVVASEALLQAEGNLLVHTYVACQGSVPAHAYDATRPVRTIPDSEDDLTPDRYALYPDNNGAEYFAGLAGASRFVNYYNTNDVVLGVWETLQNLKPDDSIGYTYLATPSDSHTPFRRYEISGTRNLVFPADTYELYSFCVEARCFAAGAQAGIGGAFETAAQVDLDTTFAFGKLHKGHSAQFRSTNMQRSSFWERLLITFDLEP